MLFISLAGNPNILLTHNLPCSIAKKHSYHPYILLGFYLGILPIELLNRIPASTRHDWKQKNTALLFGHEWYLQNQSAFNIMKEVYNCKKLLKLNKALLRIIALQRFMERYHIRIKGNIGSANAVVLDNIAKAATVLPVKTILKYLQLSGGRYRNMRQKVLCHQSRFSLCLVKHPTQLLGKEVAAIKAYCTDRRWQCWSLASVYHQLQRDKAAVCTMATFYKYVRMLKLQRMKAVHRRMNHHAGIRASKPLEIIHADATIIRTLDNTKNYVYLVQDNYSRAILASRAAIDCKAIHVFENLRQVKEQYLVPSGVHACQLLTGDGSENKGMVNTLLNSQESPAIVHTIAQLDIEYSNSMIEALNKQLKYRFLYHHPIADHAALVRYLVQAVDDYNNRPLAVLDGLTPLEVLHGQRHDHARHQQQIAAAKAARLIANKYAVCCHNR